jgi:protein involved in polysaccharide export with SLBB domain
MRYLALFLFVVISDFGCSTDRPSAVRSVAAGPYIYIGGEFKQPGRYLWTNGITVIDAIRMAGGFTEFARPVVYVSRTDGSREKFRLTSHFEFTNNVILEPDEQVLSPSAPW